MGDGKQKGLGKILVVTPRFPVPPPGACEKDRYYNFLQLRDLGYEVQIFAKIHPKYDRNLISEFTKETGIPVHTNEYVFMKRKGLLFYLKHLLPWNLDGAAYEYAHTGTKKEFGEVLDSFKPDLVWFDYTYLWPLYSLARKAGAKIITRSINFEAKHFLEEDGYSVLNFIRFVPKFISELLTIRKSDHIFAITPDEEKIYKRWGGKGKTSTLPLRGLARVLDTPVPVKNREVLNIFFMGSTYNVHHNKAALEYIVKEIAPIVERLDPGKFVFNILGKAIPDDMQPFIVGNAKYVGYQDPKTYLQNMDIALVPSLFGAGMQQKVFEPMALGLPLVTHKRAIAGYDFQDSVHYLASGTPTEFAEALVKLKDSRLRESLGKAAHEKSLELFSQEKLDDLIISCLQKFI